uniref:Uncharacterized protein n=1 Tax=Knipowitschia caucasica TaxID=637954 RepID=A0AAV2LTF8_KNICA
MISTATRTTATVSPLTPSPLNGSIVANGSPAQSTHSGFAAALRKLAKQAEEPRGVWLGAPLVPESPMHAGTAGQCVSDPSIWSQPGATLFSMCECLKQSLQAMKVPETLWYKLLSQEQLPAQVPDSLLILSFSVHRQVN